MKLKQTYRSLRFLLEPWWKHGKSLLVGSLFSALVLSPVSGWFSATLAQAVIAVAHAEEDFQAALRVGLIYLSVSLLLRIAKMLFDDFYCNWKEREIEGIIEEAIYQKALNTDYRHYDDPAFFDSYQLATEKFAAQSSALRKNIFSVLGESTRFLVYAYLLGSHSIALFLIVFFCSIFVACAQIYWSKVSVEREGKRIVQNRKASYVQRLFFDRTVVADMLSSHIRIPLFRLFNSSIKEQVAIYKEYRVKEFIIDLLVSITQLGTTFSVPVYVTWGLLSGTMQDIGVFATLIAASTALKETMNNLGWWVSQVSLGISYSQKVQQFFHIKSEIEPSTNGLTPVNTPFSVQFDHVSYTYPNGDFGLHDLNFSIQPGQKIAIVGENGAGKTTLTKLLLRLYNPNTGRILINDKPVADYSVSALRNRIGVVFQNTSAYALTVRENMIAYTPCDDEQLRADLVQLGLPLDLDANVTREFYQDGVVLSGGASQKLCLSRLLHGHFGLLILDEPSSALDPIAEYDLAKLFFQNSSTTTIMIAHRLSTVVEADKILLLSSGKILASGTHPQLMEGCALYRGMFTRQAEGYQKDGSL